MNSNSLRYENIGTFLYSKKKIGYYKITQKGMKIIDKLINNESDFSEDENKIIEEYGLISSFKIIDNRGKSKRSLYSPLEIYFDYTNCCNLTCEHCYNRDHLGFTTMSEENVYNIIKEMYNLGIERLHLAGGEPTINKKGIKNYIKTAHDFGIVTSMATNAILLDEELCKFLLDNEMFAISASIDGYNEETNCMKRGTGNFEKAVNGVKCLVDLKRRYNYNTEICIKPIFETTTKEDWFYKMTEMAIELGVDKIKFSNPERSLYHEQGHYEKEKEQYYNNLKVISDIKRKYKNQISILCVNNPILNCYEIGVEGMHGCIGGQELLTINPDGRITPCLMNDYLLGNYYDYKSIEAFLSTTVLDEYAKKVDNAECYSCTYYNKCRGGCQVRKINKHGEICGIDPLCPKDLIPLGKDSFENDGYFDFICVSHTL